MDFVLPKKLLAEMVEVVSVALTKKPMFESQKFIVFRTFDNGLLLSTMGPDLAVQIFEPVPMPSNLEFGVDGYLLSDIVNKLQGEDVRLSLNMETLGLNIKSKRTSVNMNVVGGDSFPVMYNYQHMPFVKTHGLLDSVKSVSFAASRDENRVQLMGVLVNETEVVATDGFRMAIKEHNTDLSSLVDSTKYDTIIPIASVEKLQKIFKEQELNVFADDSSMHFNNGKVAATLRKIDKTYPKYRGIVPVDGHDVLAVRKDDLIKALEFVQIADEDDTVNMDLTENVLKIWANSSKLSNIEEELEVSFNNACELMVDARFFLDVAKRSKNDTISIEIRGPKKPIVIREEGATHVIMPKIRKR